MKNDLGPPVAPVGRQHAFSRSTHFPRSTGATYLNPNVIGFQGVFRVQLGDDGAGIKGERKPDIVSVFRQEFPTDRSERRSGRRALHRRLASIR
jgi:hypothetical protein